MILVIMEALAVAALDLAGSAAAARLPGAGPWLKTRSGNSARSGGSPMLGSEMKQGVTIKSRKGGICIKETPDPSVSAGRAANASVQI